MTNLITVLVLSLYAASFVVRFNSNRHGVLCAVPFVVITYIICFLHLAQMVDEFYVRLSYFIITLAWFGVSLHLKLILQSISTFSILLIDCIMFLDFGMYYYNKNYDSPIYDSYPMIMFFCHIAVAASLWGDGNAYTVRRNWRDNGIDNDKSGGKTI